MASVVSSLRYLLADLIGEDDDTIPPPPRDLPDGIAPVVDNCIRLLVDYQGTSYAELYVHRLGRFVGRAGIDAAMLGEIAQLMAMRMSYQDPIRIAQLKLVEHETHGEPTGDRRKFRIDELVGALPAVVAEPVLDVLEWVELDARAGFDPLQRGEPMGDSPAENRGVAETMAAVLGALCQGAGLGRTLAAYDRPQPNQAASRPPPRLFRRRP